MNGSHSHEDGRHRVKPDFWMPNPRESREAAWEAIERGFVDSDYGGVGVNSTRERFFHSERQRRHHRQ
jgi:hypothetical protein